MIGADEIHEGFVAMGRAIDVEAAAVGRSAATCGFPLGDPCGRTAAVPLSRSSRTMASSQERLRMPTSVPSRSCGRGQGWNMETIPVSIPNAGQGGFQIRTGLQGPHAPHRPARTRRENFPSAGRTDHHGISITIEGPSSRARAVARGRGDPRPRTRREQQQGLKSVGPNCIATLSSTRWLRRVASRGRLARANASTAAMNHVADGVGGLRRGMTVLNDRTPQHSCDGGHRLVELGRANARPSKAATRSTSPATRRITAIADTRRMPRDSGCSPGQSSVGGFSACDAESRGRGSRRSSCPRVRRPDENKTV
jgi:hypothetical protein